jgi:hypothetical protein
MDEQYYEKLLNIKTYGEQKASHSLQTYHTHGFIKI